jgi:hypothetical protein
VVVRQDEPLFADDEAGAGGDRRLVARLPAPWRLTLALALTLTLTLSLLSLPLLTLTLLALPLL